MKKGSKVYLCCVNEPFIAEVIHDDGSWEGRQHFTVLTKEKDSTIESRVAGKLVKKLSFKDDPQCKGVSLLYKNNLLYRVVHIHPKSTN